jgi:hypothetical protein
MNNIQKRFLLFLFGCILVRFFFVYLAKNYTKYLKQMGLIALVISFGFFYVYFTKSRPIGIEVFGDKIWWNNLRPIHGSLYLLFAIFALNGNVNAWKLLLIDVLLGLSSFLLFHYNQGHFSQLF